ncbi:flagellar rod-binding protein FlgJ [Defluviimonas sp. 20V17]|uniref:Rod binding protein n=1 Tax=Allgaiera indica TaxID=765699 RepID=A0AAN4UPP3_9RHOB|nr:rod-binding protein [Allgaiera indica]KDB03895.1 flagellar rod-binding protein FlgJ [Defluviimonas sp. 20V17]GHD99255.1 hypothetical protein GCM10008024_05900 [Allgaiera indica]SDW30462.1 Rod binding protein [Allgaiera indica]
MVDAPASRIPVRNPLPQPMGAAASDTIAAKRKAVAKDFETVFLGQMVDQMMKTVKLGPMDGGHAQEMWRSFLSRAIAEQISRTDSTGIARSVEHMLQAYGTKGTRT